MTQKAEELINTISEMFSPSSRRYAESLAPLMPKREHTANAAPRRVSVFGHMA
ncbi:hypothetical protein ACSBLW_15565 [Thioclava sp. FR2]|uniref:hypothetical protein n=1 Tax=Thioclava sp. FR2 TaxID=3445780 RepID=UPI003EB6CE75